MIEIKEVAERADLIVNGYAFVKTENHVKILNLNKMGRAAYISSQGEVLETSMDDIELAIVLEYYTQNIKYMEIPS